MRFDQVLFPEGKYKAFTLSFDDGLEGDIPLIEMMNRHQVKGTFNLNSGRFEEGYVIEKRFPNPAPHTVLARDRVPEVYREHEIACHGYTHMNLDGVSPRAQAYQLVRDIYELEKLTGKRVLGMAYPNGSYDENTIQVARILELKYARTVRSSGDFSLPEDFLKWCPSCHYHAESCLELAKRFAAPLVGPNRRLQVFYVWGHTHELYGYDDWNRMEQLLELVGEKEEIWYATNGEIVEYLEAAKKLIYFADGTRVTNPTCQRIWLRSGHKYYPKVYEVGPSETIELPE
jgi:hypothetical protein